MNATPTSPRRRGLSPIWSALPLLLLLLLAAAVITAVAQRPLQYDILIGREEGWHSDLPLLQDWNTAETTDAGLQYRWSGSASRLRLPAAGVAPLVMSLQLLPASINPYRASGHLTLAIPGAQTTLPVPAAPRVVALLLPPAADGDALVVVHAPVWTPPNDPRVLGTPVTTAHFAGLSHGLVAPAAALWWHFLAISLFWLLLRLLVGARAAFAGGLLLLFGLAALEAVDTPRFALLGGPLVVSLLWGIGLGLLLDLLLRGLLRRIRVDVTTATRHGVVLIVVLLWTLRYAARLYPDAMVGDLGFHVNRTIEVSHGLLYIVSRHRGIDFPYPSGFYTLLLPLNLLGFRPESVVEWMDAWWGAAGVLPLAYLGYYIGRRLAAGDQARAERLALLTAAAYAVLAPAMMALFWSFLPHIFTQEGSSLLIAGLAGGLYAGDRLRFAVLAFTGFALIFFGHIGLYINMSLLVGLVLVWRAVLVREQVERRGLLTLLAAFVLAQLLVVALFYSSYWTLVRDKLQAFSAGGMSAVQENRVPTSRIDLLRTLWVAGLGAHYAWIGLPLGLVGGLLLWRRLPRNIVTTLWWSTLVVALLQSLIPFVTRSTISTRWLSFSAWIIAVGLAIVADSLWRRGKLGRLTTVLIYGWIGGSTLWMWLAAGGFRIRPPEPF